MMVDTEGH